MLWGRLPMGLFQVSRSRSRALKSQSAKPKRAGNRFYSRAFDACSPDADLKDARMNVLKSIKHVAEKVTGWKRPDRPKSLVRQRKPTSYKFKDDGIIPNHPRWPFFIYRGAVRLPESLDPAAVLKSCSRATAGA